MRSTPDKNSHCFGTNFGAIFPSIVDFLFLQLNISVFITVIDVNDNAPQFPQGDKFHVDILEELPIGTPISLDFGAIDRDQSGPNSHIRYRILRLTHENALGVDNERDDTVFRIIKYYILYITYAYNICIYCITPCIIILLYIIYLLYSPLIVVFVQFGRRSTFSRPTQPFRRRFSPSVDYRRPISTFDYNR